MISARLQGAALGLFGLVVGCAPSQDTAPVSAAAQAEAEDTWQMTGSLAGARYGHTAVLLQDGRVVVLGGGGTKNAMLPEIFDPKTGGWTLLEDAVPHARQDYPVSALLSDGRVLFAGGDPPDMPNGPVYGTVFDPAAGTWTPTGALHEVRREAAMVALTDGRALMTGGWPADQLPSSNTAEIYDPATNAWTMAAPMVSHRRGHLLVRLADGRVLAAGGLTISGTTTLVVGTSEIYDPATDTWEFAGQTPAAGGADGAVLADGRVLVQTPKGMALFTAGSGWKSVEPLSTPRHARLVALENGAAMAIGGDDVNGAAQSRTDLFDPVTEAWYPGRRLTRARLAHAALRLSDGRVLAIGGFEQASAEIFEMGSPGQACSTGLACASGFCADGVCCESACPDTCRSCALPGQEGQCRMVPAGEDPRGECGSGAPCADACMGDGTCGSKAGFSCGEDACAADLGSAVRKGVCVAGEEACPTTTVACGAYRCQSTAAACGATCTSARDCAEDYACDLEGHCVPPPDVVTGDPGSCGVRPLDKRSTPQDWAPLVGCLSAAWIALRRRQMKRNAYWNAPLPSRTKRANWEGRPRVSVAGGGQP